MAIPLNRFGLNPRQQRFVDEYLVDLHVTNAAIRAGYAKGSAEVAGSRLLSYDKIKQAIQFAQEERAARTEITADRVLRELAKLGFANMADYMMPGPGGDPVLNFGKLTRDQAAALVEVTVEDFVDGRGEDARDVRRVKFKLADKRAALVDIARHLGMFVERHEVSIFDNLPIDRRRALEAALAAIDGGAAEDPGGEPPTHH